MNKPKMTDERKSLQRTGYIHVAFSVGSKERVDELTSQLKQDGFEVVSGPRTTGDDYLTGTSDTEKYFKKKEKLE